MEPQFAENPREQAQMREALIKEKVNFAALQESFKELGSKEKAETAYLLSKYFLATLNRRYGEGKMLLWIKRLAEEEKFAEAFKAVYGTDLKKSQDEWIRTQARR
jgi:hypothetical protein